MTSRLLLLWLFLLSAVGARAQVTTLKTVDFETAGSGYTATTIAASGVTRMFDRTNANPAATFNLSPSTPITGISGYYWASEQVKRAGQGDPALDVTVNSFAVGTNYSNIQILVSFADARATSTTVYSWEEDDFIKVEYRFNGTGAWITAGQLTSDRAGGFNGLNYIGQLRRDLNMNGQADDDVSPSNLALTNTMRSFTFDVAGAGSTMEVRVLYDQTGATEELAMDNIIVRGTASTNQAPVLGNIEPTALNYAEGAAATVITTQLTVTDGNDANISSAQVRIAAGGFNSSEDRLLFTTQNGISGNYDIPTGILALTGTATKDQYRDALRSVRYQNIDAANASTTTRTVSFTVTDPAGASSAPVTRDISITAALDPIAALPFIETFETDGEGTRYASNTFFVNGGTQFLRTTDNPRSTTGNTPTTFTGIAAGTGYWFGENAGLVDNPSAIDNGTLTTRQINAAGFTGVNFSIRLGASTTGTTWQTTDYFKIYYRTGGSGAWTAFASWRGTGTGIGGAGVMRQDTNPNAAPGSAAPTGTQLTTALNTFNFPLPALNGQIIEFQLVLVNISSTNDFAFDQIEVTASPAVTTAAVASVTGTSAVLGGNVTSDGGATVSERGVVYSTTNTTPTTADTKDTNGTGTGTFSETIGGLTAATTYYVRAYAINAAGTSYGNVVSFTTPTAVSSIVRASTNPTNASSVNFTLTFAANVTGLTPSNFNLTTTGFTTQPSISSISGSGTTYTVVVNTGSGSGTLRLNLNSAAGLTPGVSNAPYTSGETYDIDKAAPTVTISSGAGASGSTTTTTPIPFTVTFSENVTGFVAGDVTVTNGSITGGTVNGTSPGTTYTFTVTPTTPGTATTVNVPANVAQDAASNGNTAAPAAYSITYSQPVVATAQNVTVNLDASGNATLNASSVNNGSTGSGTLTYTIQKIVYGKVAEGQTLTLTTPNGANFTQVRFASYGAPIDNGNGNYAVNNSCNAANSVTTATNSFVGRSTGSMDANNGATANNNPALGDPCSGTPKSLAVQVGYSANAASLTYACSEANQTNYVLLTVSNGTTTSTSVARVTVNPPPTATITNATPNPAQRGATVTVTGTNLSGATSLTVNGALATISSLTSSGFTFVVPVGAANSGNLVLTLPCSQTLTRAFTATSPATYTSSTADQPNVGRVAAGSTNQEILRVAVVISGTDNPLSATSFSFTTAGSTNPADIAAARVYYTGTSGTFATTNQFGSAVASPSGSFSITGTQQLATGTNYFFLVYDVAATATNSNLLDATVPSLTIGGTAYTPSVTAPAGNRQIIKTSRVAGSALRFTGTSTPGYVDFSASATPAPQLNGGQYTQTAWIRRNGGSSSTTYYVLGNGTGSSAAPFIYITGNGRLGAGFGSSTAEINSNVIIDGEWNHVVSTFNGTVLTVYLNGSVVATATPGTAVPTTRVNYIGGVGTSGTSFFPGDIDEVSTWNRALTQTEIRQLRHLTLNGLESGLVSYLQFNESGTTSTDAVSGAVGTLTGAVTRVTSTAPIGYGTSALTSVTGAGNFTFPGTNAAINFTTPGTTPYDVVVSRLDGQPLGTQPTATGLVKTFTPAYWIVDRYNASAFAANITYTLSSVDISAADAATPSNLKLFKRGSNDDGAFTEVISATSASAAAGTVTFPVTSFSQTVIGTFGTSPLPVTLVDFTAERQGEDALIKWTTSMEKNNAYFAVESSVDGREFSVVERRTGQGNSTSRHAYQVTDRNLSRYGAPLVYYRLRQVDFDGTTTYSDLRTVRVPGPVKPQLALYPNPARTAVKLTGAGAGTGIQVFDAVGRLVINVRADASGGAQLTLPDALPTGVYVVRAGSQTQRLVVE